MKNKLMIATTILTTMLAFTGCTVPEDASFTVDTEIEVDGESVETRYDVTSVETPEELSNVNLSEDVEVTSLVKEETEPVLEAVREGEKDSVKKEEVQPEKTVSKAGDAKTEDNKETASKKESTVEEKVAEPQIVNKTETEAKAGENKSEAPVENSTPQEQEVVQTPAAISTPAAADTQGSVPGEKKEEPAVTETNNDSTWNEDEDYEEWIPMGTPADESATIISGAGVEDAFRDLTAKELGISREDLDLMEDHDRSDGYVWNPWNQVWDFIP